MIQFADNPGTSILPKAFGCNINPQDIAQDGKTLIKTENQILKDTNLIYIEAPIGAGYSQVNTKNDRNKDFGQVAECVIQVLKKIMSDNKDLEKLDWYFNGEGFSGVMMPFIMWHARNLLNLKVKAMILECPFLDPLQYWSNAHTRQLYIDSGKVYKGCCHNCSCSCYMGCANLCFKMRCVGPKKFQDCHTLPWKWWGMSKTTVNQKTQEEEKTLMPNPENLLQKELNLTKNPKNPKNEFLFGEAFKEMILSSTKTCKKNPKPYTDYCMSDIWKMSGKVGSRLICGYAVKAGIQVVIISGDQDPIMPWKGQQEVIDIWDWCGSTDFKRKNFIPLGETKCVKRKTYENLEWANI